MKTSCNRNQTPNIGTYLGLSLAMMIVGSSAVAGKLLVARFPVFLAAGLRYLISTAILVPILLRRENGIAHIPKKDRVFLFLQALTGTFLFTVFLLYGLKLTSAIESGIISSSTPAVLGLISFFFLKERPTWKKGAGIALTLIGVLAVNLRNTPGTAGGESPIVGGLLIFGAAVGEALFTVFRKVISDEVTPLASATIMSAFGLGMFLPFAVIEAGSFDFTSAAPVDWLIILYYGVVVTVVAFLLWFGNVTRVNASTAAVFTGVWPVSTVLLSYVFLGEQFALSHLVAIVFVLLGIIIISRSSTEGKDAGQAALKRPGAPAAS